MSADDPTLTARAAICLALEPDYHRHFLRWFAEATDAQRTTVCSVPPAIAAAWFGELLHEYAAHIEHLAQLDDVLARHVPDAAKTRLLGAVPASSSTRNTAVPRAVARRVAPPRAPHTSIRSTILQRGRTWP
jgi:hypothetical protein